MGARPPPHRRVDQAGREGSGREGSGREGSGRERGVREGERVEPRETA